MFPLRRLDRTLSPHRAVLDHNSCRLVGGYCCCCCCPGKRFEMDWQLSSPGSVEKTRSSGMCKCTLYIYVAIINAVLWKLLPSRYRCPLKGQVVYWNGKINFIYLLSHNRCEMAQSLAADRPLLPAPSSSFCCPQIIGDASLPIMLSTCLPLSVGQLRLVPRGEDLSITATDLIWFSTRILFIIGRIWARPTAIHRTLGNVPFICKSAVNTLHVYVHQRHAAQMDRVPIYWILLDEGLAPAAADGQAAVSRHDHRKWVIRREMTRETVTILITISGQWRRDGMQIRNGSFLRGR